jgi:hypothetical protein
MTDEYFEGPAEIEQLRECLPNMWSAETPYDEVHVNFSHPLPAHIDHRDFSEISGQITEIVEEASVDQSVSGANRFGQSEFKGLPSFSYEIYSTWPVDDKLLGLLRNISRLIMERWPD